MLGGFARSAVVSRYTIERELGSGAYGTVYAARDGDSGQLVALKHLSHVSPAALSRFKQEFRAVQGLNHPHIVRLDALIEHESGWLIAMELVEGCDLLTYVKKSDNDPSVDEAKLRAAFSQLAQALAGLHEHGILHCDLKPANVRVGADGRVVLLDFGFVTGVANDTQSAGLGGGGTVAYMAPEQAAGGALSPATDWYAFGACLYEALTGALPFEAETSLAVMFAKQNRLPVRPSERRGEPVFADLEALCMQLLATRPANRPSVEAVQRVLPPFVNVEAAAAPSAGELDGSDVFLGREDELAQVTLAHHAARAEGLRVLFVEGESGMGKTALVAEWLTQLKRREPAALILRSQCYENEHSAFKAFDAGMETLARRLNRLRGSALEFRLPANSDLLPRIFPGLSAASVMKRVPSSGVPADPSAALRDGLVALAGVLERFAESGPVVVVIDDLQWADAESFRLLRTLGEAAHAPHVLILATVRPETELEPDVAAELALLRRCVPFERLRLEGLSPASCEKLAYSLLTGSVLPGWLDRITTESKGHPLFVSVLSRYAVFERPTLGEEISLDLALGHRLSRLGPDARALLDVLALSGVPCSMALLSRTLGEAVEPLRKQAAELVSAKLSRRVSHERLACFHDRIRSAVLERLGRRARLALHQALATSIEADPGHDPAFLAEHLEGAGLNQSALSAHRRAGDRALSALAFGKAEQHYARALEMALRTGAEPRLLTGLRTQRGHALARAGRSALSAQQYLDASEHAAGAERIELRVWAAQHLLQSAQVEAGLKAAREVLAELGVPLPRSAGAAVARMAWDRVCLSVTGMDASKGKQEVSAEERVTLDAMWNLSFPVGWVELLPGAALTIQHLRRSLSAGDHAHVARALANEAAIAFMQGPDAVQRAGHLFARARTLYDAEASPALEAWVLFYEATAATFCWDVVEAQNKFQRVEALLLSRCPGEPWLLVNVRYCLSSTWWLRGQLGGQVDTIARWLVDAADRDDRFAIASIEALGMGAMRFVLRDEPGEGEAMVSAVMAPWPRVPFALVHVGEGVLRHVYALYAGGDAAWQRLQAEHKRYDDAFLFRFRYFKDFRTVWRCQAGLSAYVAAPRGALADSRLAAVRTAARLLARTNGMYARLQSPGFQAQLAVLDGQLDRALALTRAASEGYAQSGMGFEEPPIWYLQGLLEGGDGGRERRQQALTLAATQGWKNPHRYVSAFCPVITYLEARS